LKLPINKLGFLYFYSTKFGNSNKGGVSVSSLPTKSCCLKMGNLRRVLKKEIIKEQKVWTIPGTTE
jgi:hypothetical protein